MLGYVVDINGGYFYFADLNQHGLLHTHPSGHPDPAPRLWGAQGVRATAHQRQVLEFRVLQIHLCLWRHECAGHGRSGALVLLV